MDHQKALIAMSGGVDSSVAAWLTLCRGTPCGGAIMQMFPNAVAEDVENARAIAQKLGIPFSVIDACAPFRHYVQEAFVRDYEAGMTPNPCIVCNRHLKFGFFLDWAHAHGYSQVVTGHYARITRDETTGRYLLRKALDEAKDQSYFLSGLSQEQLSHIQLPLGAFKKPQIRQMAQENGFLNAKRRDSQDICFVPDGDYMRFLREFSGKAYAAGAFLDQDGRKVGTHQGAVAYTLGQRKGLGLAMGTPVYVCGKDMAANTVTVGPDGALFRDTLLAGDFSFFPFPALDMPLRCKAKTRSRMTEQPATVYPEAHGAVKVVFDQPQRAITPGQAVVLYDGDTVLGGGTITQVL